jgi:hypothetical protein
MGHSERLSRTAVTVDTQTTRVAQGVRFSIPLISFVSFVHYRLIMTETKLNKCTHVVPLECAALFGGRQGGTILAWRSMARVRVGKG